MQYVSFALHYVLVPFRVFSPLLLMYVCNSIHRTVCVWYTEISIFRLFVLCNCFESC